MSVLEIIQRVLEIAFVIAILVPIYKACKKSLLEDLAQRKQEREKKKNG